MGVVSLQAVRQGEKSCFMVLHERNMFSLCSLQETGAVWSFPLVSLDETQSILTSAALCEMANRNCHGEQGFKNDTHMHW